MAKTTVTVHICTAAKKPNVAMFMKLPGVRGNFILTSKQYPVGNIFGNKCLKISICPS